MKLKLFAALVAALTTITTLGTARAAEGNAQSGQTKATVCFGCHGTDGNSANPEWPSLAGQHPQYIQRQLQLFKNGTRQNPLMNPLVAPLSDQDIADLAAFFSSQSAKGGEAEPSKLEAGQHLYRGGDAERHVTACSACHGPRGAGNPAASYPAIRGQHTTYIAAQLRSYRKGERTTDPNQIMRNVAAGLSDAEIDAVASYVQGLR